MIMTRPYLGNPKYTIEVLQKYNFAFQKRFGQNFLIDTHVLEKIIASAEITKDDFVLEIGPGIGTMTQYLAEAASCGCRTERGKGGCHRRPGSCSAGEGSFGTLRQVDGL